jgi:hypothetical protein
MGDYAALFRSFYFKCAGEREGGGGNNMLFFLCGQCLKPLKTYYVRQLLDVTQ